MVLAEAFREGEFCDSGALRCKGKEALCDSETTKRMEMDEKGEEMDEGKGLRWVVQDREVVVGLGVEVGFWFFFFPNLSFCAVVPCFPLFPLFFFLILF
jgi:hypothetical protein